MVEKLKKIEECSLSFDKKFDKKIFLQEVNNIVNNYLSFKFNKKLDFYLKIQAQNKQKTVWDAIEFIENVNKFDIYNDIKKEITNFQVSNNVNYIIFGNLNIKTSKKLIYLTFPFFTNNFIESWDPNTQLFVVRDISTTETLQVIHSKVETLSVYNKLFEDIVKTAINKKASDIHIIPKENAYYVYFRINGFFIEQNELKMKLDDGEGLVTYMLRRCAIETKGSQFNPDTRLIYQDARISLSDIGNYDARLAFIPDGYSLRHMEVVIRLLQKQITIIDDTKNTPEHKLQQLGFFNDDIEVLLSMLTKNKGVCVISGVTNSGKSTLVNILLSSIKNKKVGSVEDPIEYNVSNANFMQHQLFLSEDDRLKMDFVDYIKAFKRADYDIIFVGEWRNHPGLTEAIIEQSFAGQLIFTTLHIANSFQIFESLKYMYNVSFEQLKSVLLLSWNQLLFPKLCDKCKQIIDKIEDKQKNLIRKKMELSVVLDEKSKNKLDNFLQRPYEILYVRGKGCNLCNNTGYSGRQVIYDYFVPNYVFWEKLGSSYSYAEVLSKAEQYTKSKTKIDVFIELVKAGVLSIIDIIGNEYVSSLI